MNNINISINNINKKGAAMAQVPKEVRFLPLDINILMSNDYLEQVQEARYALRRRGVMPCVIVTPHVIEGFLHKVGKLHANRVMKNLFQNMVKWDKEVSNHVSAEALKATGAWAQLILVKDQKIGYQKDDWSDIITQNHNRLPVQMPHDREDTIMAFSIMEDCAKIAAKCQLLEARITLLTADQQIQDYVNPNFGNKFEIITVKRNRKTS